MHDFQIYQLTSWQPWYWFVSRLSYNISKLIVYPSLCIYQVTAEKADMETKLENAKEEHKSKIEQLVAEKEEYEAQLEEIIAQVIY